ncbi:MAG: helix-turn-helix domain-containing protein [Anaerolineales bacterium]|nr:helix-turn-helix domain-containing protein [Anaerolineales bacterium]
MFNQPILSEVNIGDVLRMVLPLNTLVAAGETQTRRNVAWFALLSTWQDLADHVKAGDLVIVPTWLHNQITTERLQVQLQFFATLPIAGLLFFQPVADEVVETANSLQMPLLIVPPDTAVRDIHRAIAALLIDRHAATTERGLQLYRRLSDMSREGQGLQAMTDIMSKLTGKIVAVQDKRLEIRAISWPGNLAVDRQAIVEAITQRDELPAILRNRKAAAKARPSYWQQLLPVENMGRLISPIISGDRARGYVSVVGKPDELDMLDSLTVEHGAAACALEMAKAKAVSEAKKALRGDFLEGILAGNMSTKEMQRLTGRLDHDTQQPHMVLVFAWAGDDAPSLRRLETAVNWLLRNHSREALVHVYGVLHICIFHALKGPEDVESAHEFIRRLREQMEAEFPNNRLIGGMSGPAYNLAEWPAVYQEALQAMDLGKRLKLSNFVVDFNSLGVYRLLGELEDLPSVKAFTQQVIGPLVEYDADHRGSLVQTLDAYFAHHGNISQTAESLFVHRNTLLYRLERIQELTRHDMNQADVRLALQLALKFWQLRPET